MSEIPSLLLEKSLDAVVLAAVLSATAFLLKTWIERTLDVRFKLHEERTRLAIELQRVQATQILERRGMIYPELLEVVYRLRNCLREIVKHVPTDTLAWDKRWGVGPEFAQLMKAFDPALYILTENLYKYRALVDESTFDRLHAFKRVLQDAAVILDRLTRKGPPDELRRYSFEDPAKDNVAIHSSLVERLGTLNSRAETLFVEIDENIRGILGKYTGQPSEMANSDR